MISAAVLLWFLLAMVWGFIGGVLAILLLTAVPAWTARWGDR